MGTEIPHRRCDQIPSRPKKGGEVVGLIFPVCEIASAGAAAHALLIYMQDELIVSTHVNVEMLRRFREVDHFSEVKVCFISLRSVRNRNPLRLPQGPLVVCPDL